MKKSAFNILFLALSLGIIVPSQGWSAGSDAVAADPSQQGPIPSATSAQQQVQPGVQEPNGASVRQESENPTGTDAVGSGVPGATEGAAPSASAPDTSGELNTVQPGSDTNLDPKTGKEEGEEKKGEKRNVKKKRKHRHGKGRHSHSKKTRFKQPPESVIQQLNTRNSVEEASVQCAPKSVE